MFNKLVRKLIVAASVVCVAGSVAAASACNIETDHPEVQITVEFNGASYDLNYTLYRNMYPNTVRHFLELAENGYYSDMLVHDYRSNDWITGGFKYSGQEYADAVETNGLVDYLESHSAEQQYMDLFHAGKLTTTVYSNQTLDGNDNWVLSAENALPTLIGEFRNNINQEIEQGARTASYGSLKMYYYTKSSTGKVYVTPTSDQNIMADYKNNCATSLFAMQVSQSSALNADDYCVFGNLTNAQTLTDLLNAVNDRLAQLTSETISVTSVSVDNLVETFSQEPSDRGLLESFTLSGEPLVIKSVKVTGY